MRIAVVDLLCNSPPYCGAITGALCNAGAAAELVSPDFFLEPGFYAPYVRSPWLVDIVADKNGSRALVQGARALQLLRNYRRLCRAIRAGSYDVVHVQWIPHQERQTLFMSRLRAACDHSNTLLVFTAHNVQPHDSPASDREKTRKSIQLADLVVGHTQQVTDELRNLLGVDRPIVVIPHGPLFADRELPPAGEASRRLGMGDSPVVLFQGAIHPYKGIRLLAEAWPSVRRVHPAACLAIVGRAAATGEVQQSLEDLSRQPGVRIVGGWVSTELMLDYYALSSIVVFPYTSIWQSGALMTAVGLGRPSVVTPLPGFLEQMAGLSSVTVAADVSASAVAEALCSALDRKDSLAAAALLDREHIMRSPAGWASIALRTLAAYSSISPRP